MYRLIYKFVEPNQNLGHKVRVRHIDGFGSSSMFSPREFQFGSNVGSNSVRFGLIPISIKKDDFFLL